MFGKSFVDHEKTANDYRQRLEEIALSRVGF
jgi:hypothetical protein